VTRYRACLVDDDLEQLTLWAPVDPDGTARWDEVFAKEPIRCTRYLVHEVALDLITIRLLSAPIFLCKGDTARMADHRLREPSWQDVH